MGDEAAISLRDAAVKGVTWTAGNSVAVAALQFGQIVVLARLLTPEDFGLLAVVTIVTGFGQIFTDFGTSAAIIHHRTTSTEQLASLYWLNILSGVILFLASCLLTAFVADLFHEPALDYLIPIAALVFVITPIGQQFQVLMEKDLQFDRIARYEVSGAVVGTVVAIGAAALGAGVISFIAGQLASSAVRAGLLAAHGFKKNPVKLLFRRRDLDGFLDFGLYQMGDRSLNFLISRVDQIVLGALVGPHGLGLYNLATNLVVLPISRINPILTRVAFPVLAKVQDETSRLKQGYLALIGIVLTITSPLLLGIAAVSSTLIPVIFGNEWRDAATFVQPLAVVALMRSAINPVGSLILAKGRPNIQFYWSAFSLSIQVPCVFIAAKLGGAEAVAVSLIFVEGFHSLIPYLCLLNVLIGATIEDFRHATRPVALALLMALVVGAFSQIAAEENILSLAIEVCLGVLVYGLLSVVWLRDDLVELRTMLLSSARRRVPQGLA